MMGVITLYYLSKGLWGHYAIQGKGARATRADSMVRDYSQHSHSVVAVRLIEMKKKKISLKSSLNDSLFDSFSLIKLNS